MNEPVTVSLPPPSGPESPEVRLSLEWAYSYTRPLLSDCRTAYSDVGSAVLVGIGNRLFAATAAHCLGDAPLLVLTEEVQYPTTPLPIMNRDRVANRDVAFLEIENDERLPRLPMECLSPDLPALPADPLHPTGHPTWIIGYPLEEFVPVAGRVGFFKRNFGTYPQRITEDEYLYAWPLSLVRYQEWNDAVRQRELVTTPVGYSGGGAWTFHDPTAGELVTPKSMMGLHAIQSAFVGSMRAVRCIPIRWWIKLVHDRYPDLRELLAERFNFLQVHKQREPLARAGVIQLF